MEAGSGTILGIGTAHRACSLAMIEDGEVCAARHDVIGRGHAERLMPMLAELLGDRRPARIVVEVGPGSFTGIRIGIAAARALALAWKVPVHGISSTLLTAVRAFADGAPAPFAAVLDGGRGEVFVETFSAGPESLQPPAALPAVEVDLAGARSAAGTGLGLIDTVTLWRGSEMAPDMADLAQLEPLAPHLLPPQPIYVRAPDAKLPTSPC